MDRRQTFPKLLNVDKFYQRLTALEKLQIAVALKADLKINSVTCSKAGLNKTPSEFWLLHATALPVSQTPAQLLKNSYRECQ